MPIYRQTAKIAEANTWSGKQTFTGGVQVGASATTGHVLTADASGNATFQAAPQNFPWVPIFDSQVNLVAAAANTYIGHREITTNVLATTAWAWTTHYIDPADYAISGKATNYRLIASFIQSTTANAGTSVATAGLYPVVPAGTTTVTHTAGTVIAGSTAARTGGAASSEARIVSSNFTIATADTYGMAVAISVATTAGATKIALRLERTYV